MRRFLTLVVATPLLLWLLAASAVAQIAPPAGTVARIQGNALAVRNAVPRVLTVGEAIQIGDVLSTGADSRLEVKMIDDATFTLGAETAFVVVDYTFGQAGNSGTLRVIKGAFAVTSGKIAQLADNSMKVQTEIVTIGIRGTTVWGGPIDGQFGVVLLDGRAVTVENAAGRVDLTVVGAGTGVGATGGPTAPNAWAADKLNRARETIAFR